MTDKGRILISVVIEEGDEIARKVFDVIGHYLVRTRRVTVAPLVWDDDMVARSDKWGHLVTPGIGVLRPAVAEHNGPASVFAASLENFEVNAVDRKKGGFGKIQCIEHHLLTLLTCAVPA
ncbi:hypothetical protein GCM10011497_37520 [Elstera cyanobacteriorum]|nr:hypothetical protein GCM10011497_37520 [Elstera cyanobacteriorum]